MMIKTALFILAAWLFGLTVCFGLLVHELMQTREQAVIAQSVSMKANENTDKWARDYAFHIRLYHEK